MKLKRLLNPNNNANNNLYAIKVSVCDELRHDLKLNGREKRGRMFIEKTSASASSSCSSLKGLKMELHAFFRALRKSTYLLQARLPELLRSQGSNSNNTAVVVVVASKGWNELTTTTWNVESDEDVLHTFQQADEFFEQHHSDDNGALKRPSIWLHVSKDPNAPLPPPPPVYLENMTDPSTTDTMTFLSFYAFPPDGIVDPDTFAQELRTLYRPFNALGRIYVATEGVNAQMSIPTNVLSNFMECCRSIPELGPHMENGINIDPKPVSVDEFSRAGVASNNNNNNGATTAPPFSNLHIRVRNQVVADGLDQPLDWQSAGYDMPPMEWHERLKQEATTTSSKENNGNGESPMVLLDCRNSYESDLGRFEQSTPLNTQNFRESWNVIRKQLNDTPKDTPIMMYCTGGIRCVKVGAYVTQELGFTNVNRLAGGIIAYDRALQEQNNQNGGNDNDDEEPNKQQQTKEESLFRGTNFVFDGRLGRAITEDDFGACVTCGAETSAVSNCLNTACHKRMIQCEQCRTSFHGTCSEPCKERVINGGMVPGRRMTMKAPTTSSSITADGNVPSQTATTTTSPLKTFDTLEAYSEGHSSPVPSFYKELELNTQKFMPTGAHMISGSAQGRLLTQLASMTRKGRVLEIGTFTGYATACLIEGAANAGAAIGYDNDGVVVNSIRHHHAGGGGGPMVMSLERDPRAYDIAVAHLSVMEHHNSVNNEQAAEAACALRVDELTPPKNVEEDTFKFCYKDIVSVEVRRVSDALATIESMAKKSSSSDVVMQPFDLVFVDADKTRLLEYVDALVSNDNLLKTGGLIVVDNVLWKGLVLEASSGRYSSERDIANGQDDHSLRKGRRARKLASKMHYFNSEIVKDARVEVMVLPMRDGLSVIRKR